MRPYFLHVLSAASCLYLSTVSAAFSSRGVHPSFVPLGVLRSNGREKLASFANGNNDIETYSKDVASQPGTRREVIKKIAAAALATSVAAAQTSAPVLAIVPLPSSLPSSLCDPTVSSLRKGSRIVHIIGTAHISSVSADLAGQLIREVKPDAVFVELDLKRIGRAFKNGRPDPGIQIGYQDESGGLRVGTVPERPKGPAGIIASIINAGSKVLGSPIQSMYKKLESEGFLPGAEFINAVQEGLDCGAVIVLGDRDMDVTLQRIARALAKTDAKKLIEVDKKLSDVMKAKMPEMEDWQKSGKFGPDELRVFVETMKTKDTTKELMDLFKVEVPEIHNALVGERDVYMARNINSLSQFETMVAVLGLGHLDGIDKNLRSKMGWSRVAKVC